MNGSPVGEARGWIAAERVRLEALAAALRRDHEHVVAASLDPNADDEHDPEGATITFERSQVEALPRQAESQLNDVARAEDRLDAGTYFTCEICDAAITPARLEARPAARAGIACAARPQR